MSKGLHYSGWLVEVGRGDLGRRLRWQFELELVDEELEFGFGMGVAGEENLAPVGGRQMNIDHLDGGELFQRAACGQSRRQGVQATRQRDLHAISQERDEDVGFDPFLILVEDGRIAKSPLRLRNASSTATSRM